MNKYVFTASDTRPDDYNYVFESDKDIDTLYKYIYKIIDLYPTGTYVRMPNSDTCIYIAANIDEFYIMNLEDWLKGHTIHGSKLPGQFGIKLEDIEL